MSGQQAELIRLQTEQGEIQRSQLEEQRTVNARQAEIMKLQAQELRESLEERKLDREQRHRAQASHVFFMEERVFGNEGRDLVSRWFVSNSSEQPVYDVFVVRHGKTFRVGAPEGVPLLPGHQASGEIPFASGELPPFSMDAIVYFRDAAGTFWCSNPAGQLYEITQEQVPHDMR